MISLHPVYVWSTVGYTNSILFFALFTSWPVVCKRSVFLQFCDQIQTSMHQIFTQIHSTVSIGPSYMYVIPAGPKWDFLLHANTTHPLTIKALQTTERAKLSLLSLPSMWFLTRSCYTPCPTGKRSWTSMVKPCCANNDKATTSREVILSYKILYQILYSWNATLLTFHFPGTIQHNFVPKFHNHSLE